MDDSYDYRIVYECTIEEIFGNNDSTVQATKSVELNFINQKSVCDWDGAVNYGCDWGSYSCSGYSNICSSNSCISLEHISES